MVMSKGSALAEPTQAISLTIFPYLTLSVATGKQVACL